MLFEVGIPDLSSEVFKKKITERLLSAITFPTDFRPKGYALTHGPGFKHRTILFVKQARAPGKRKYFRVVPTFLCLAIGMSIQLAVVAKVRGRSPQG